MMSKIEFPTQILVGENVISRVGAVASEFAKEKKALVVSDENLMKIVGNDVVSELEGSGFSVSTLMTIKATPESVESAQKKITKSGASIAFGVGGGTCIDVAKLSSAREGIPFISFPTATSHDGINSPIASIKLGKGSKSYPARAPVAVIADLGVLSNAPPRFMPAGCGDLVSNYTSVEDWKLAHSVKQEPYNKDAADLSIKSARMVLESADQIAKRTMNSIKLVVEALIISGNAMCIAGSSRPCSGAEHAFSHVLDKIAPEPAMHGEQCGVGTIMTAYLQKIDWQRFKEVLQKIGAPTTAKELRIEPKHIIKALSTAHKIRERYTILGENGISRELAEKVATETGVI